MAELSHRKAKSGTSYNQWLKETSALYIEYTDALKAARLDETLFKRRLLNPFSNAFASSKDLKLEWEFIQATIVKAQQLAVDITPNSLQDWREWRQRLK